MALRVLNIPDVCEDNVTLSILRILNIRRALKAAVALLRKELGNGLWSFSAYFPVFRSEKRDDNVPGLVHIEFRVPWGFASNCKTSYNMLIPELLVFLSTISGLCRSH